MAVIYGTVGTDGDEILIGSDAAENFDSGYGNDTVYGGGGDDLLAANHPGNKVFYGQGGHDTIWGQIDDDFHYVAAYEGPQSQYEYTLNTIPNHTVLTRVIAKSGSDYNDFNDFVVSMDELRFADKSLFWTGNRWSTVQRVTDGDDRISLSTGDNFIGGKAGNDYIRGNMNMDKIYGGSGDDKLDGGEGDDYLSGGLGSDSLYGGAGKDFLEGFKGNDVVHGNDGNDTVYGGGEGVVYLFGDAGNDTMQGGSTGEGRVKIMGGEGDDVLKGAGSAYLQGDAGQDIFYFSSEILGIVKVLDFMQGEDKLYFELGESEVAPFDYVMAHATENTHGDTVIKYTTKSSSAVIVLSGIAPGQLTESDFLTEYFPSV